MRTDPVFLSWIVRCESEDDLRKARDWLTANVRPGMTLQDQVVSYPGGAEACSQEYHRLEDYFTDVQVAPGPPEDPLSFRLIFHRRPDAGRFWKDFMVRLLQTARTLGRGVTTTLDYRGDEAPAVVTRAD